MVETILLCKANIQKMPITYNRVLWGEQNQVDEPISQFLL